MIQPSLQVLRLAAATRARLAGVTLSPHQAKLYSQHIRRSLDRPGLASFGNADIDARVAEARLLLDAAFVERDGRQILEWRKGVKRAGEIFEWLSHAEMPNGDVPLRFLAAGSYQLAGYPAMARGLLAVSGGEQAYSSVLHAFLMGDFPRLLDEGTKILQDHVGDSAGPPQTSVEGGVVLEVIRALSVVAAHMRWGDNERVDAALEKLLDVAAFCRLSEIAYSGLIARISALVTAEFSQSSLWTWLRRAELNASRDCQTALERFGRRAFLKRRSLAWSSQAVGIDRLLKERSFVLCTPTGSGKTTIAELALIIELFGGTHDLSGEQPADAPLAMYLVPSRALASEVERRFAESLTNVGPRRILVTGLYGGTDWGPTDAWLTSDERTVLICTYEKAEALMRFLGPIFMKRLKVVVIDEAHSVQFDGRDSSLREGENRALRLEHLATRLFRVLSDTSCRVIALSAVAAGTEMSLARWVVGQDNATPARSDEGSTRQLVGRLECRPGGQAWARYDILDRTGLVFTGGAPGDGPFVPNLFPPHPPAPSFPGEKPLKGLRPYLVWAAVHLARLDVADVGRSVLISIAKDISSYASDFLTLLEEEWADVAMPRFFEEPSEALALKLWSECLETAEDYFTRSSPEYRLLEHGIAVHHGKMPGLLARRLKAVVESGLVRIVLATSTLSEGVNLPVEYILVPDLFRGRDELLSPQEFMNLVGRAGRPGVSTEGRTLVLVPPDPGMKRSKAAASARRQIDAYRTLTKAISRSGKRSGDTAKSPLGRLLELLRLEWQKLARSTSDDEFLVWLERTPVTAPAEGAPASAWLECLDSLDGLLLASIEELELLEAQPNGLAGAELEAELRSIWERSYARVVSQDTALLESIFLRRGRAIPLLYESRDERHQIYKTSLPPLSARALLRLADPLHEHLKRGADYAIWGADERFMFIQTIVEQIGTVKRFALGAKVGRAKVAWRDVLRWWLDPSGAGNHPQPKRVADWHAYVSKYFSYKTNWALGSIVALALDGVPEDVLPSSITLDEWPASGLPWSSFWIKELLNWGTLEPVAAFLLARGGAITRRTAEAEASRYYASQPPDADPNELLDPRKIRDWFRPAGALFGDDDAETESPIESACYVRLARPRQEFKMARLRVQPSFSEGGQIVNWMDIAGYLVATSAEVPSQPAGDALVDYILDVSQSRVTASRYL